MEDKKSIFGINKKGKYMQKFQGKVSLLLDNVRLKIVKHTGKFNVAEKIKSDDIILKALNFIEYDFDQVDLAKRIKDDSKKVEALKFIKFDCFKAGVAETISNDEIKLGLWEIFEKEDMHRLINSLNALEEIESSEEKEEIFYSILEKNSKENVLEKIKEQLELAKEIKGKSNDDEKIENLHKLDSEYLRAEIISTIQEHNKKMQELSLLNTDAGRANVIKKLDSDDEKIKALSSIKSGYCLGSIVDSIKDDNKKLEAISLVDEIYQLSFAYLIEDDSIQIEAMIKYASGYGDLEMYSIAKDEWTEGKIRNNEKFKELKRFLKMKESKNDNERIDFIDSIENENLRVELVLGVKDKTKSLEALHKLKPDSVRKYRYKGDIGFVKDNIKEFMELEGVEPKNIDTYKNFILNMFETNNEIVSTIDFRILEDKYIKEFGVDKINQISCYPKVQERLLNLKENEIKILSKCIAHYEEKNKTELWTPLAQAILENIDQYEDLVNDIEIENISDEDIEKLNVVMQDKNDFRIKTLKDLKNYDEIRKQKCDEWIKTNNIERKRLAVLEKIFGQGLEYTEDIIEKYGEDIESIENQDCKDYIFSLKAIMELDSSEILEKIYDKCREIEIIDKVNIERIFKKQYGEKFNEDLFKVEDGTQIKDGVYEAGTEFKIIMTSVGAYCEREINDYKEDWNRPAIASQHFCTSYIRNDMIGTAPINNICYRIFTNVK